MPIRTKQTCDGDDAFFTALARGEPVIAAAVLTGCSRQALYRRRITDRAFDKRWRDVIEGLERKRRARVRRRFVRPIFERPGGYSNGNLLGRLKILRPGVYREPCKGG